MLTKIGLTEKIIRGLASLEEAYFIFRQERQLSTWLNKFYYRQYKREKAAYKRGRKRILEALNRLEKAKTLSYSHKTQSYQLSTKGWLKYLYYYSRHNLGKNTKDVKVTKKKFLVIFDIPETHRRFRDILRKCLQNQDCQMIQKSVFICYNEKVFLWVKKVVANCELDGHVLFIEADKMY